MLPDLPMQGLYYLDSSATAALLKELSKQGQLKRAVDIFDWLRGLPSGHELSHLCDLYTYTTMISQVCPAWWLYIEGSCCNDAASAPTPAWCHCSDHILCTNGSCKVWARAFKIGKERIGSQS
eukprot:scaffold286885_cov21-Tisochrysis_lutea.AAC.2